MATFLHQSFPTVAVLPPPPSHLHERFKMCWCLGWPFKDVQYEPAANHKNTTTGYRYQWNGQSWDLQEIQVPNVSSFYYPFRRLPTCGLSGPRPQYLLQPSVPRPSPFFGSLSQKKLSCSLHIYSDPLNSPVCQLSP
jgi:hypothetical protein